MEDVDKSIKIYFDMDGVLAAFLQGINSRLNQAPMDFPYPRGSRPKISDLLRRHNIDKRKYFKIFHDITFWENLPVLQDGMSLYAKCRAAFGSPSLYILTDPGKSETAKAGKLRWLTTYIPDVPSSNIYFMHHKEELSARGSFLIDDYERNVDAFNAGEGIAFLYPRLWNSSKKSVPDVHAEILAEISSYGGGRR